MATKIYINTDLKDLTANAVANKNRPTQVVRLPQIVEGETLDVELSLVNSNGGYDSRSGDATVSLAVAVSARGAGATSGTFTLTAGTATTAPITSNASGQAVQDALNALNGSTGAYGSTVVVTKLAAGSYRVIFDTAGARTIFGGTSINLAPESEVVAATSVVGSSTIRAQQVIQISQQPAIYTSTWTTGSNKFSGQLNSNTARVQELIATSQDAFFEVKADDDVICQVPILVLPAVAAPNSLPAHTLPSNLNNFANDPSTNGNFNAANWLTDLGSPENYAVWGNITGTLSGQTDLQSALDAKAPFASPALTGNPTAPTKNAADNSTSIATTAYVDAQNSPNNKGFFATPAALSSAYPTGQSGWYAIVGTTDTFWVWDADTTAWLNTDSNSLGTVTSVTVTGGTGLTSSGSPITTSGSIALELDTATQNTLADVADKANIESPTFTGDVTAPRLITNEIQSVGTTTGTAQPITYDSKEHRFRDYDETPSNLMVIKKADGVPIGKVGINQNNPVSALHVVGGHTSGGGIPNEALRVVGSGLFTSTDQTALVVAGDTDDNTAYAGTLLKLKRDAGVGEIEDEINTGYVGSNGGGIYGGSSGNAAFIQVINGRKLEIATGATSFRRLQVSDAGVDITGNIVSSGYTQFGSLTTGARNSLTAANGMVIYNSSLNKFQGYENGAWVNLV